MSPLGDFFPAQQVEEFVLKRLIPGCVIRIDVTFPQITKPKFLVLVDDGDPDYLTFIINSETHQFIESRPHLAKCQVDIDATNHPFLDYDSKIACHETLVLKRSDVLRELKRDTGKIKGHISDDVKAEIVAAVKFAKTLSAEEKNIILASLA